MRHIRQLVPCPLGAFLTPVAIAVLLGLLTILVTSELSAAEVGTKSLAEKLIDEAGIDRGLCVVLGCDRELVAQLVQSSNFLVHVRVSDPAVVAELRGQAMAVGVGIDRVVIEQGDFEKLPYADNTVDLLVMTRFGDKALAKLPPQEVLRVLRPMGTAIVVTTQSDTSADMEELRQCLQTAGIKDVKLQKGELGAWVRVQKPALLGVDEWTHWEHGPDNNPVSSDQVIKAPYLTQFLAEPFYIGMPSITTAAGGRTFLATGHIAHHRREWDTINKLIARNGYNGTVLWQRDLAEGYLAHRSAFIATKDTLYMIDGDGCLMLDAQTGMEKGRIQVPDVTGHWKWMVMRDGVLYVLTGDESGKAKIIKGDRTFGGWSWADLSLGYYRQPRVPWGFGHTLAAYQLGEKRLLWKHTEEAPIDSRALSMRDKRLFLYCPEKHLRCLDSETGKALWTNEDAELLGLIEEPGRKLTSTPGFRSACLAVATPDALILQGQTRMNVVAVSVADGYLLWKKKKITNNPNALFVDDHVVLGVGKGGTHVILDPVSGAEVEDLKFRKAACTRLTASSDSFFVRGEGTLRFDRKSKKVLIDGAVRPACNDGVVAANGMLYIGPWACDCNLSLIGAMGKCSAGDFPFDYVATDAERLQQGEGDTEKVAPFEITDADWPVYRANNERSSSTTARLARPNAPEGTPAAPFWAYVPKSPHVPAAPTSAGGLVFVSGQDGVVRALDAKNGQIRWQFATAGPIKMAPTIWEGRAFVGSGDGCVYALEAVSGRLLWRFRAAPIERLIMVYGNLCSTWPVNTGVLVHEGVAYFAAGIIDSDGTYVYAVDAKTGKIKWQNNSSGHLNAELRKGVSAQGNLTILGDRLLMAGGNQLSPAQFNLETGECLNQAAPQGRPQANHGKFVGVFRDKYSIAGGRTLYAAPENVANKDSFVVHTDRRQFSLNHGGIPPAWNDQVMVMVNYHNGKINCCDAAKAAERIERGFPEKLPPAQRRWYALAQAFAADKAVRWESDLNEPNKFEAVSLAVCPQSIVAVVKYQVRNRAHPQWAVAAFSSQDGTPYWFWRHGLPAEPLPDGLLVGREGQVVVTMLNGSVLSFGTHRPPSGTR